jgi:hypothetical protein
MQSARVPHFKPSVNGFRFPNDFEPGPLATISIATLPNPVPLGDASNGLCGGMTYAVADFFLAQPRLHIPETGPIAPALGQPLTNYIIQRFIDSFALWDSPNSNAYRYVDLMSTLDHNTAIALGVPWIIVNNEWPKIKADLDGGKPSLLGLVDGSWVWPTNLSAKLKMLKGCHQVLAYGYDLDDAANLTLLVYDPNDPYDPNKPGDRGADESTISLNIGHAAHSTVISTPRITEHIEGHETFRAFFRHNYYSPVSPVAGLSPGPLTLSATASLEPIPVDQPVELTVTASDVTSGRSVIGAVWSDGVPLGPTNTALTSTFNATWHKEQTVDPRTHEKEWHWVGPHYPVLSVTADDYDRVRVHATFTGADSPPPDPDDP